MAIDTRKVILNNRPEEASDGQYNYGDLGSGFTITGIDTSGVFANNETELYTTVEGLTPSLDTGGILWLAEGSKIKITSCDIDSLYQDTDDPGSPNYYRHVQVAFYMFDEAVTPAIKDAKGSEIRDLIGEGNDFGTSKHLIAYWNKGKSQEDTHLGDVVTAGPWTEDDLTIRDFPSKAVGTADTFDGSTVFSTDMTEWTRYLTGQNEESNLWIIVRTAGDEKEYAPLGHGWLGLSGGHKIDERDRGYYKFKIPKKQLFDIFFRADGETIELTQGAVANSSDDYGTNRGHKPNWLFNDEKRMYDVKSVTLEITAPTWTPKLAEKNFNAKWVDWSPGADNEEPFTWFNPNYQIDYYCWPEEMYNEGEGENYFKTAQIANADFRPISFVSGSIGDVDVQNYYIPGTEESQFISAPSAVKLHFELAEPTNNFVIDYIDVNPSDIVKYGFFVDNWDWQPGDNESFDEITDDMPQTGDELQFRSEMEEAYSFKQIGTGEFLSHAYNSPGLKIIKAIIFSYMENSKVGYEGYKQTLWWKTATVRINIAKDSSLFSDFNVLGGDDFTYFPYPETYKYPAGCFRDDCEIIGSHPFIGGMSAESVYMTSLKSIVKSNQFSEYEGRDKLAAESAYEYGPGREHDEFGDFPGELDIGQIRYSRGVMGSDNMGVVASIQYQLEGNFMGDDGVFRPYWDIPISGYETPMGGNIDINFDWDSFSDHYLWNSYGGISNDSPWYKLFIDDEGSMPFKLLFDFNFNDPIGNNALLDTTGNNNRAILIGDYSLKKDGEGKKVIRDSNMLIPKIGKSEDDKAF